MSTLPKNIICIRARSAGPSPPTWCPWPNIGFLRGASHLLVSTNMQEGLLAWNARSDEANWRSRDSTLSGSSRDGDRSSMMICSGEDPPGLGCACPALVWGKRVFFPLIEKSDYALSAITRTSVSGLSGLGRTRTGRSYVHEYGWAATKPATRQSAK